ncbi:hypothetical protein ABZ791_04120 [Streptomyces huasconensis]|uniref:Uncharacterized protein n=1 Tax=Streptomyces huasconensis TaxID=1854574 RepID=A0ABV3M0U7_9ACTN
MAPYGFDGINFPPAPVVPAPTACAVTVPMTHLPPLAPQLLDLVTHQPL